MNGDKILTTALVAHYRKGFSMAETADRFGISVAHARRIRDRGVVAHYKAGHGMGETAARFGVTKTWVWCVLRRDCPKAIRRRRLYPPQRKARDCEIAAHYPARIGVVETPAQVAMSPSQLKHVLRHSCR